MIGQDITSLTYAFSGSLAAGQIVEIPVGKRKFVGVVLRKVPRPDFECKEILRVIFDTPLPTALLKLHAWMSEYYATNPGTVWQTMLPSGLAKKRRGGGSNTEFNGSKKRTTLLLNDEQQAAVEQLSQMKQGTAILHGITGSGKTNVYIEMAQQAAEKGKSSIILVPEISLTAQLVENFRKVFPHVLLTHSTMTESQRALVWQQALTTKGPTVIIGPRSALFMPVPSLGLIVIDECHEPTYRQERAPRYNTLRAASILADKTASRLILGSATPLISDVYMAKKLDRPIVEMKKLAISDAKKPATHIVDLTNRDNYSSQSRLFSRRLLEAMKQALADKKQILLFHNRRGSASTTLCENCGWMATCPRCYLPLTLHSDTFELRCHLCNHKEKPPTKCPDCGHSDILHRGIGTKRIEVEVRRLFPDKTIRRFDGDTVRGQAVHDVFSELHDGTTDIIIGTQAVAKGLDLPNLALVGVVQADAGLNLPDFSSAERTFQLIAQATGRVGRRADASTVIIQTYQPDAPAVTYGAAQNFDSFYTEEIKMRAHGHFPPFAHLLKLTCTYKTEKGAVQAAIKLAGEIQKQIQDDHTVRLLGPAPAFYERARDTYRWQIVVRSASRTVLNDIAKKIPPTKWTAELDPGSLI
jgi:primosomal protein N' (replication factor Y)